MLRAAQAGGNTRCERGGGAGDSHLSLYSHLSFYSHLAQADRRGGHDVLCRAPVEPSRRVRLEEREAGECDRRVVQRRGEEVPHELGEPAGASRGVSRRCEQKVWMEVCRELADQIVTISGSSAPASLETSQMITESEIVMRVTPPSIAAAPTSA